MGQAAERFEAVARLVHEKRTAGKSYADVYTLMGCMFFSIEKPANARAALAMRLAVKTLAHRLQYDTLIGGLIHVIVEEQVRRLHDMFPNIFPSIDNIGLLSIPDSVLEELHNPVATTPAFPHEPQKWKRKIRLSKGT